MFIHIPYPLEIMLLPLEIMLLPLSFLDDP
jgi:hypothetical protein